MKLKPAKTTRWTPGQEKLKAISIRQPWATPLHLACDFQLFRANCQSPSEPIFRRLAAGLKL